MRAESAEADLPSIAGSWCFYDRNNSGPDPAHCIPHFHGVVPGCRRNLGECSVIMFQRGTTRAESISVVLVVPAPVAM